MRATCGSSTSSTRWITRWPARWEPASTGALNNRMSPARSSSRGIGSTQARLPRTSTGAIDPLRTGTSW